MTIENSQSIDEVINEINIKAEEFNINDYLVSPIPEVKNLAERAVELKAKFESKDLSQDEYEELVNDLLDVNKINEQMSQLELAREFWQLVNILKNIKFFASLI